MHVSLTDLLTCPRCGPEHGLVLLPAEVRDRRVAEGVLGCPNCRERYPIEGGVADLREPGAAEGASMAEPSRAAGGAGKLGGVGGESADAAGGVEGGAKGGVGADVVRLAALLGLAEAAGVVVLWGAWSRDAADLAELVPAVEVVVAGGGVAEAAAGYTTVRVSGALPFRTGSVRGVGLKGASAGELLGEGGRVLSAAGRLVVEPAGPSERAALEAAGLRVLAAEGETVVVGRSA